MKHLPWSVFDQRVTRYDGDNYVKALTCSDRYRSMAFAQLIYRTSLRDIEMCLRTQATKLYGNYMRKCAIGGQSLANAERGVDMSGYEWICWQDRGLTRLRPHWDQGRVLHFGLETGCDYTTIVRW